MSKVDIATQLAYGLMAYDPKDPWRQGYSIGNALMAVASRYDLDRNEVALVADRLVEPLLDAAKLAYDPDPQEYSPLIPLGDALERFGAGPAKHRA